jgi:DNA circularisation protein N-terminus
MPNIPDPSVAGAAAGAAAYQAAANAGPGPNINDLFDQLLEFTWRGIGFPVVETEIELRQDLVIHKMVDRDSAHVEATGRAPMQFTARIPFLNRIAPGKAEKWVQPLYPTVWKQFFAACADKSTGPLRHPEIGDITCKCEIARTRWAGDVRSGVFVSVTWIETDDSIQNNDLAFSSPSPISNLQNAALDLDGGLFQVNPAITPQPYVPPTSFQDLVRSIRSVFDQVTLSQKQFAGRIDNVIYQAQSLEDAFNRAVNASALNWPLLLAAEQAKSACYDLKATQLTKGKRIAQYTTQKDASLGQVAAIIGAPITDIMALNPAYVQFPILQSGSVIRYYLAA